MDNPNGVTRQNYAGGSASGKSKLLGSGALPEPAKAGGSGDGSGPTGSKRTYPKGGAPKMDASGFNPMNCKPTGWVVNGHDTGV